ncbi:MAG: BF3164 family lipoprotein [Gracilimonas sp.]|nr:BF3164 family lipoprotein [Gracilimonas sp.]
MKLSFKILTSSLIIILCSCQNSDNNNNINIIKNVELEDEIEVTAIHEFNNQVDIFNPFKILNINENYLLISELRQKDFFHVFSLPNLKYKYTTGDQGRGPGEFITPPTYIDENKQGIEIYDPIRQTLRFFSINDTSMAEYKETSLRYAGQIEPLNRPKKINDTTYFADYGTSLEKTNREHIALKPAEEESLFTFGNFPSSDLKGFERYSNFLKSNVSQTNGNRFAAFYMYHNRFKIYDDRGQKLVDATIDEYRHTTSNNSGSNYLYRVTAYESENYIYLLGIYALEEKIYDNPDPNLQTSIEVWTWEGKPVYRAKFDRLIHGYTVSEKFNKIYGFSYLDESTIFEYDLDI